MAHVIDAVLLPPAGYLAQCYTAATDMPDSMKNAATGPAARPQFSGASFFDPTKAFAGAQREKVSLDAFDELLKWLSEEASEIAIFDASNVTMKRRALLQEKINAHSERCGIPPMSLVFIESICTDEAIIREQMLFKVRHSPDFATMAEADALADLQKRIEHYEKIYDTVREEEGAGQPVDEDEFDEAAVLV